MAIADTRFTGSWPPLHLLADIPHWEFALDEEGLPGQDETTLRPCANQTLITFDTAWAAGTLTFANGSQVVVLIDLFSGDALDVVVLESDETSWMIRRQSTSAPWSIYEPDTTAAQNALAARSTAQLFPAVIRSHTKHQDTGTHIEAVVTLAT